MKTTNSKDLVKVNQILPIMQEHFGQSMNLARIKLMALLLHALCVVQTVSLHKLADAMPTAVDKDSNLRRLQRFFAKYVLDLDIIARMIFSLLPVKTGLVLSMDRTNWKFGEFNINILMLGITYKGIAFPLIFSLLPKRGNSSWNERRKIMERFIRLFGAECIDSLVADREFIGKEWTGWLNSRRIRYYIRIRQNFWIVKPSTGERIRAWWLFNDLKVGQEKFFHKLFSSQRRVCLSCRQPNQKLRWSSGIADSHMLQPARGCDFDIQKALGDRNGLQSHEIFRLQHRGHPYA